MYGKYYARLLENTALLVTLGERYLICFYEFLGVLCNHSESSTNFSQWIIYHFGAILNDVMLMLHCALLGLNLNSF